MRIACPAAEGRVHGTQMRQRVRIDTVDGRTFIERIRHRPRAAKPARADADGAVPEARPAQILAGSPDRNRRRAGELN